MDKNFKEEIKKIPNICKFSTCVFEQRDFTTLSMWKKVQEQKRKCPRICPKYNGLVK